MINKIINSETMVNSMLLLNMLHDMNIKLQMAKRKKICIHSGSRTEEMTHLQMLIMQTVSAKLLILALGIANLHLLDH